LVLDIGFGFGFGFGAGLYLDLDLFILVCFIGLIFSDGTSLLCDCGLHRFQQRQFCPFPAPWKDVGYSISYSLFCILCLVLAVNMFVSCSCLI
jgi:hypothetical protein